MLFKIKNKKGQFYIIGAIIIALIVSGLTAEVNSAKLQQEPQQFSEITETFEVEMIQIIDNGVATTKNQDAIEQNLNTFAETFTKDATAKDPEIGFLYVYGNKDEATIVNYLRQNGEFKRGISDPIRITGGNAISLNKITASVGGEEFTRFIETRASAFSGINSLTVPASENVQINILGIPYNFKLSESKSIGIIAQSECGERGGGSSGSGGGSGTRSGSDRSECHIRLSKSGRG